MNQSLSGAFLATIFLSMPSNAMGQLLDSKATVGNVVFIREELSPACPLDYKHVETPSGHEGLWNGAIGDLDSDGDLDVVVVGIYSGGVFSILMNRGDGSFDEPVLHTIGEDPRCVLLEDLDGDLDLDLIVSTSFGGKLLVYENPGDGVFGASPAAYEFPEGVRPIYFTAGDLDDDGDPDIAVSDAYGTVPLLLNDGDGSFEFGPVHDIATPGFLYEVIAEDLNGDDSLDLAVLTLPYDPPWVDPAQAKVLVLTNDGGGSFGDLQSYDAPPWPTLVLAAHDVDGDGDLDLAGVSSPNANPDPNGMWLLFNDGLGHFGNPAVYAVGPWPHDVDFGDLDADGDLDAVVANEQWADAPPPHDVSILLNRGDGTFEDERRAIVGYKPSAVLVGDLDGHGELDIITANFGWGPQHPSTVSVLFSLCGGHETDQSFGTLVRDETSE